MNNEDEILSELLDARRGTRDHLRKRGDSWKFDEESADEFDSFFEDLLNGSSIRDIADKIRQKKGRLKAVNILGGGQVLRDIQADFATAVRLEAPREKDGVNYISGDLLQKKTWQKIPDNQDFILSMGRGGLYGLTDNPDVLYFLANNMWSKMSSEGSIALFQVPHWMGSDFEPWIKEVSLTDGIAVRWKLKASNDGDHYYAVLLVRSSNAPRSLPTL